MRPSPALNGRLKTRLQFTTKDVGKGFYRGTRVGSLGAHTPTGNYVIDYRKARHFVVPNLKDFELKPYVSPEVFRKHTFRGYIDPNEPAQNESDKYAKMNPVTTDAYLHHWFEQRAEVEYELELDMQSGRYQVPEVDEEGRVLLEDTMEAEDTRENTQTQSKQQS